MTAAPPSDRAIASGKFLQVDGRRFLVKGVSYGTFAPDANGEFFPAADITARDIRQIAAFGGNTLRTYTPPPTSLLDEAHKCGVRVVAGIPWPQHTAFLEDREGVRRIRQTVRHQVARLAAHPATLLLSLGNEIPPTVVRWYGRNRIECFLRELVDDAKSVAPDALLTYVNYPPTEFLDTSCFDVCSFNVFLHDEAELSSYLARLQLVAGARPLLVSEAGADSAGHGQERQAALVAMQLRTAFREGACGAIAFSWTDEWWRGGQMVEDWKFGLVDEARTPKLAYTSAQRVFADAPFDEAARAIWPSVSVIVCAYNAADTIDECLTSLEALDYPNVEVIVIDDGSRDETATRAAHHQRVRLITVENGGLSVARNIGLREATGTIVAYTDADVRVDPSWLTYLVQPFLTTDVVAAGGPNFVPADDPWMAQVVARSPGGPTHVLLDDRTAEHVPGCNCAFRRTSLLAIGGFDATFLRAGDDVDVCWRLQDRGWTIGFAPSAFVWHRHRSSLGAYYRQQVGYGEGETWLKHKHPDRFVRGRPNWRGHIYSPLPCIQSLTATHINAGVFGSAPFPSVYRTYTHHFAHMPHTGPWQAAWITLCVLGGVATLAGWPEGAAVLALGLATLLVTVAKCLAWALDTRVEDLPPIRRHSVSISRAWYRAWISVLHFVQPFARIRGHARGTLAARATQAPQERSRRPIAVRAILAALSGGIALLVRGRVEDRFWSAGWIDSAALLFSTADRLRRQRAVDEVRVDSGWWEDRDLSIRERPWFRLDVRALIEDFGHEGSVCRVSIRLRPTAAVVTRLAGAGALVYGLTRLGLPWAHSAGLVATGMIILAVAATTTAQRIVTVAIARAAAEQNLLPLRTGDRRPAIGSVAGVIEAGTERAAPPAHDAPLT